MSAEPDVTSKYSKIITTVLAYAKTISATAIVLIFIVNSLALSLLAFNMINPPETVLAIMGVISLLFSSIVLGMFVHIGVDNKINHKRRK